MIGLSMANLHPRESFSKKVKHPFAMGRVNQLKAAQNQLLEICTTCTLTYFKHLQLKTQDHYENWYQIKQPYFAMKHVNNPKPHHQL